MIKRFMVNYGGVLKECRVVTDKDRSAQGKKMSANDSKRLQTRQKGTNKANSYSKNRA